jgi:hypothetical protein
METILFIIYFIFASFLAFYVPGRVLLGEQKKLSKLGSFATAIILGIVLWGWQGYVFGFLQLRNLSYLYLLVFLGIFIFKKYYAFKIPEINLRKFDWVTISIVVVGILGQIMAYIRNGQMTSSGLFVSYFNNIDHIWHVSLVDEFVKNFPPNEPGMYGILLVNYHFWFHLVTAEMVRVFHLPIFQTQFVGMYPLASILLALIGYSFAVSLYKSKFFLRLFLFFLYFSNDAMIWFILLAKHYLKFNVGAGFEDATKFIDAPGRGYATIIILAALYILYANREKILRKNVFIIGLLLGSLMGFKVYFGIPIMFGAFCLAAYDVLKKKFATLGIFLVGSVVFLLQYLPFNLSSGGLIFIPFEIPRSFIAQLFPWVDQRWAIYGEHKNYLRLIEYGIFMSVGYLFAQLGVKLLGMLPSKRMIKQIGIPFSIFLYSVLFSSMILGLFFYQKIGGANIWEFFLASSLILAITVSLNISLYLTKANKFIQLLVVLVIVILILPRWASSIAEYLKIDYFSAFHGVSNKELQAYDYLKNNTAKNSLVLVVNQESYVDFASIASVLSERNLFFSGEGVSQKVTSEIIRRKKDLKAVQFSLDTNKVNSILKNDKINYIYLYAKPATPSAVLKDKLLQKVFSNDAAKIFKVSFN